MKIVVTENHLMSRAPKLDGWVVYWTNRYPDRTEYIYRTTTMFMEVKP